MMPKEMQTRLRSKVFSLGGICNKQNLGLIFIIDLFASKKWVRKFWPRKIFLRRSLVRKNFMSEEILVQEKLWDRSKLLGLEPFRKFSAVGGIQ